MRCRCGSSARCSTTCASAAPSSTTSTTRLVTRCPASRAPLAADRTAVPTFSCGRMSHEHAQRLEQAHRSREDDALLAEVRARLQDGDMRPGDRVLVDVQGDTALSDTFTVWPDRQLHLP